MSACNLPYDIEPRQPLKKVLGEVYNITKEQRSFMWTKSAYVMSTVDRMYDKFKKDKQEWMGQVVVYYEKDTKKRYLYDAQHRLTVVILVLLSISHAWSTDRREKILKNISRMDDEDNIDPLDADGAELLSQIGGNRIANLRSEYENDLKALNQILQDGVTSADNDSMIGPAYEDVHTFIKTLSSDEQTKFYKYCFNDIYCDIQTITDWDFIPEVFEKINNIGMALPLPVTAKNKLISQLGRGMIPVLRILFESIKDVCDKYDVNQNHILHLSAWFHTQKHLEINKFIQEPNCLRDNTMEAYHDFTKTVQDILSLIPMIKSHLNYSLLDKLTSGHEIITTCILPLLYAYNDRLDEIISILIAASLNIKNGNGKLSLNSKKFQVKLIPIVNKAVSNGASWNDTSKKIKDMFREFGQPNEETFVKEWVNTCDNLTQRNTQMVKAILCYIWYTNDAHETIPDYSKVDLEHILPQSSRSTIGKCIDSLGNLTLFLGPNSDKVKGNRSLQDKPFSEKLQMYLLSNIKMTRDLNVYSSCFGKEQIKQRELFLINQIYTAVSKILFV
jgi:hypothetical protein